MVGILVHRDNHFIVRGSEPDRDTALELVRLWSVIQIGGTTPPHLTPWRISTREFREDLKWAAVVGGGEYSAAVVELLEELRGRGVEIRKWDYPTSSSIAAPGSHLILAAAEPCESETS